MLVRHGLTVYLHRQKHDVVHSTRVARHERRRPDGVHHHAKLFVQLTRDGITVTLAGFALATGELPKAAVLFVQRTLAHQ